MTDTPDYIYAKQFEIFFSKPPKERVLRNLAMTEFVRETTRRRIKRQNPKFSDLEVKIEMFRQFYSNEFTPDEMENIIKGFIAFDEKKKANL